MLLICLFCGKNNKKPNPPYRVRDQHLCWGSRKAICSTLNSGTSFLAYSKNCGELFAAQGRMIYVWLHFASHMNSTPLLPYGDCLMLNTSCEMNMPLVFFSDLLARRHSSLHKVYPFLCRCRGGNTRRARFIRWEIWWLKLFYPMGRFHHCFQLLRGKECGVNNSFVLRVIPMTTSPFMGIILRWRFMIPWGWEIINDIPFDDNFSMLMYRTGFTWVESTNRPL